MAAIAQLIPAPEGQLDDIVEEIARYSTALVRDAWKIGVLLLKAKELIDDDVAFGRWRAEKLTDLGLTRRTAQRLQNIAARFPDEESLPTGLGLTALYDMSGTEVSDTVQARTLERVEEFRKENGEAPSYRQVAQMLVQEKDAERRIPRDGQCRGAPAADELLRRQAEQRAANGGAQPREAAPERPEAEEKVEELLRYLSRLRSPSQRAQAVSLLQTGLRRMGAVTVGEDIIGCSNVRTHTYEYRTEK